jgi:hypothetical protein
MARFNSKTLLNDPAVSASFTTDKIPVSLADRLAFQITVTDTLVGIVSLEASLDETSWAVVPDSVNTVDSSVPSYVVELRVACAPFYRVTFDYTAGLGEVSVNTYIKGS